MGVGATPAIDGENETIAGAVDSGACDAAGPLNVGARFPVKRAEAPKSGKLCNAASGAVIEKY